MMDDSANYRFSPWFNAFYKQNWVKLWWENLDRLQKFKDIETEIHPVSPINNSLPYNPSQDVHNQLNSAAHSL